jgi:rapamycin-insensitive companion of mTOR
VAKLLTQVDTKGEFLLTFLIQFLLISLFSISSGPCYRGNLIEKNKLNNFITIKKIFLGICLPRNILDLFPEPSHSGTYVSRFIQEFEMLESNNLSASSILMKNQYANEGDVVGEQQPGVPDESAVSSMSDLSASNRRVRKKTATSIVDSANFATEVATAVSLASSGTANLKHNKSDCLLCCRTKVLNRIVDVTSLVIQEPKDHHAFHNGKMRDSDVSFYSPESIISDDSANTNMPDRISNMILRSVIKMANPILYKGSRKVLMELKQKYPQSFQDFCLYSEICKQMSRCSYRKFVRRFVQEIFFDLNYDAFNNGVDLVLDIAQQRLTDLKLLNNSMMLPSSSSSPQSSPANVPHSSSTTTATTSSSIPISQHKLHSQKPLLASVYETSIENLVDSPPITAKDEVDAIVTLRSPENKEKHSPGRSTRVMAEIHAHRHSLESGAESLEPLRRRRFNTLELDLSCTKNKFPIKHRSPTSTGPLATSTLRRPTSLTTNQPQQAPTLYKSIISTSDHSFEASSRRTLASPISPTLGPLFCEQRKNLTSSRSEATLSNKGKDGKKIDNLK